MQRALTWLCVLLFTQPCPAAERTPMLLLYGPALSPDGSSFVFEWDNDIWQASTDSGEARKVASTPGRDMFPRISPDGKTLVFTTDENGFAQVVSQPIGGGEITRHTDHTEGSQLECISPDGSRALVRGLRHKSGYKPWRLMEIDLTQRSREAMLFDATAHTPTYSPDGRRILFCRGGELPYRRGFRGSRASRIWSFDRTSKEFRCEIPGDFEARSPMWMPDGSGLYFVSNKSGTANIWKKMGDEKPEQITFITDEEILSPDLSADGTKILFRYGGGLIYYNLEEPKTPKKIRVFTREALDDRSKETVEVDGCQHVDVSFDNIAIFSEEGELWSYHIKSGALTRLTTSPATEEWPVFLPYTTTLIYLSDDGIDSSIMRAEHANPVLRNPKTLYQAEATITNITPSPDGKSIAWIEGRGDLKVMNFDGWNPRTVFPCWDKPTFSWSPDGQWLAVAAEDANANRDIHLVPIDGSKPPINLTRHPAFDGSPKWSPDGRRIVFTSKCETDAKAALWCIDFGMGKLGGNVTDEWIKAKADAAEKLLLRGIEPRRAIWNHFGTCLYYQSHDSTSHYTRKIEVN